jgi:hypothetical protein
MVCKTQIMRTISSATAKLSDPEIKCFLACHIPYRLEFLKRGIALASDSGVRDPALVEAALMAGRQLIQFLGLGIEFRGYQGPFLKPCTKYKPFGKGDDRCFEVKIVNLGGDFQNIKEPEEERLLAEFLYAGQGKRSFDRSFPITNCGTMAVTSFSEGVKSSCG